MIFQYYLQDLGEPQKDFNWGKDRSTGVFYKQDLSMDRLEGNEWLTGGKLEVYFTIHVRKYKALNEDAREKMRLMKTFLEGNS